MPFALPSGMVTVTGWQTPPVTPSAPSVFGVSPLQLSVVALVVPYLTTVCDAENCEYLKAISMALQPALPTEIQMSGSSVAESSLSAPPELQKLDVATLAPVTHHWTRRSPSTRSVGPDVCAKSEKYIAQDCAIADRARHAATTHASAARAASWSLFPATERVTP